MRLEWSAAAGARLGQFVLVFWSIAMGLNGVVRSGSIWFGALGVALTLPPALGLGLFVVAVRPASVVTIDLRSRRAAVKFPFHVGETMLNITGPARIARVLGGSTHVFLSLEVIGPLRQGRFVQLLLPAAIAEEVAARLTPHAYGGTA